MNILVIGCGYWGSKLAERFRSIVGATHIAVTDLDEERARQVREQLKVRSRNHIQGVLRHWSDACVVATPPATHYEIAKQCLNAGKHVLVEKPMALDAKQAVELVYMAQEKKLTLMTDATFLYTPLITLGGLEPVAVVEAYWTGPRRIQDTPDEGILWTLGPHPVSLMLNLMARYPITVEGKVEPRFASLHFKFTGGDEARIVLNWNTPIRERYLFFRRGTGITSTVDFDHSYDLHPEPLMVMCRTFVERCNATEPWIDYLGMRVVEVLEFVEDNLCK